MIDSHTHLHLLEQTPEVAVEAALEAGVERILTIGLDISSSSLAGDLSERFESVYFAVGLHPNSADRFGSRTLDELHEIAQHPRCRAIGETGLDFFRDVVEPSQQMTAFRSQIELAREVDKPLVVHTRSAEQETIDVLSEHASDLKVIIHCFSMPTRLEECLNNGWWISFAGNITYPKNGDLVAAAEQVPLERLLIETDAPYLTPQAVRKHRNQPAYAAMVGQFIALRRGMTSAELSVNLRSTSGKLFDWY